MMAVTVGGVGILAGAALLAPRAEADGKTDKPMPAGGHPAQEIPPCEQDSKPPQFAINDACWFKVKRIKGRCPGDSVVYKGTCYEPVNESWRTTQYPAAPTPDAGK